MKEFHISTRYSNSNLRSRIINQDRTVAEKIIIEGLPEVILRSNYFNRINDAYYRISDIKYEDEGTFKLCHKVTLQSGNQIRQVALLTSKESVSMQKEFSFYSRHYMIKYFPAVHELFRIKHNMFVHGKELNSPDFMIREFIDAPDASNYRWNDKVMLRYLYTIRSLMKMGIRVDYEMDAGNLRNAFYFSDRNSFKFIDDSTGRNFYEGSISRLIRGLSSERPAHYRNMLTRIFIGLPEFKKNYGDTMEKLETYWVDIDSIP